MPNANLEDVTTHFKFGDNWSRFSEKINDERINEAVNSLLKFLTPEEILGKDFIDIGCGSGLFSLAALRLGANRVVSIDIDRDSVKTTLSVLKKYSQNYNYKIYEMSVFDIHSNSDELGKFDIVFSWGALHHTGDMKRAILDASTLLRNEQSKLLLSLYSRTHCCPMWANIKLFYSRSPRLIQAVAQYTYIVFFILWFGLRSCAKSNENILLYLRNYHQNRGMSFLNDVHDWLGGYPYESISPKELAVFLQRRGMSIENSNILSEKEIPIGLFSSGCNEYLIRKTGV